MCAEERNHIILLQKPEKGSLLKVKTQALLWLYMNAASPAVVTHIKINAQVAKEAVKARLDT